MTPKRKPPALPRAVRELLRDVVLLDGDESNPFGGGEPLYVVPDLDAMARRAAFALGRTRRDILKAAARRRKR